MSTLFIEIGVGLLGVMLGVGTLLNGIGQYRAGKQGVKENALEDANSTSEMYEKRAKEVERLLSEERISCDNKINELRTNYEKEISNVKHDIALSKKDIEVLQSENKLLKDIQKGIDPISKKRDQDIMDAIGELKQNQEKILKHFPLTLEQK